MRSDNRVFKLFSAVVACYVLASTTNAPYYLPSALYSPFHIRSTVTVVTPPITAGGFLYDRTTGAILFDAVTGAALFA